MDCGLYSILECDIQERDYSPGSLVAIMAQKTARILFYQLIQITIKSVWYSASQLC